MSSSTFSSDDSAAPTAARRHLAWLAATAVTGFALIWLYVGAFPTAFLSVEYVIAANQKHMLDACDLGEIAIFGDSRAETAIIPNSIAARVSNFSLPGTTPVETWFAVQRAMRCPTLPRWVIIAHGAHAHIEPVRLWRWDGIFEILNSDQRLEVKRVAAELNDTASLESTPEDGLSARTREWAYDVRFPPLYAASLVEATIGMRWFGNHRLADDLKQSRGHLPLGEHNDPGALADEAFMTEFRPLPVVDHYVTKTLTLLDQRGVNVLYLPPPVNQSTHDRIGTNVAPEFLDYLRSRSSGLRHAHVVDDVIPCWPNGFFSDRKAHLNAAGAREYTREVNQLFNTMLANGTVEAMPDHCQRQSKAP